MAGTGKANPAAQKWANLMTEKYDELSVKEPVLGELRNLMDLCVAAALISREGMLAKANLELPNLLEDSGKLKLTKWTSPKTVDTYRSRIMEKLSLHHRSELVRFALKSGLLKAEQ